jgi:ELWxxDGT repeat protein
MERGCVGPALALAVAAALVSVPAAAQNVLYLVEDIVPGSGGTYVYDPVAVNGKLYFTAYDGIHGYELWESDGTAAGTALVADLFPGVSGSNPSQLTVVDETLYFNANDGENGREVWAIPEPGHLSQLAAGITALIALRRRSRNRPT